MINLHRVTVILLTILTSCNSATRLDSDDFSTSEARTKILQQEIRSFSAIRDAEFELFNVNGFTTQRQGIAAPGASSWNYKFVIKVDTADVKKWIGGMERFDPEQFDNSWATEIVKQRKENW